MRNSILHDGAVRVWLARAVILLVSALALAAVATPADACTGAQKKILLISSFRANIPYSVAAADRFTQRLRTGTGGCVDDYTETIDATRFGETNSLTVFREYIARKYDGVRFDLIIALHRPAVTFATMHGRDLFPGTPVFFIAGKGLEAENRSPGPGFAGVVYKVDLRLTLESALRLQPDLREIVVVSGASEFDRNYERGAREQFASFSGRLRLTYLTGMTLPELEARARGMPSGSALLLMAIGTDRLGNKYVRREFARRLADASAVPVYSPDAVLMGDGIIGGRLMSVDRVLDQASGKALQLLEGVPASAVGVTEVDPEVVQYDARQMAHWRILESRVPAGGEVLFRQPSLWETHRLAVAATLSTVAIEAALISALLFQGRRWRRAEVRVRDLAGRLLTAAETERARMARDLHDGVCQEVSCLAVDVAYLRDAAPRVGRLHPQTEAVLLALERRALGIADSLRQLSHELHPVALQHLGLAAALPAHCAEVERRHGLRVTFETDGDVEVANPVAALALFRVAQEALANSVRHAHARSAVVAMARGDGHLSMTINDDGHGFDTARAHAGLGLISMQERIRLIGGHISITSRPQGGTTVAVRVPVHVVDAAGVRPSEDELLVDEEPEEYIA